ncbi:hypothetical protein BKP35_18365 [Anaerobacillus arseniciselenatis]|uniref:Uncharacterized protein n=1 Tax=Anaerobacillus arseniciselenatis TaxID=85682 RepID=A0A1S2L590_9BACI|nr:hypothetical protein [Anaerobacillus arseniciselenatis]OIJ07649.1 hypothetical protein BKP35_18365 [Anaerobacillus arseniciselenatis]
MKKYILYIPWVVLFILLVSNIIFQSDRLVNNLILYGSWLYLLISFYYRNSDRFYLFVKRLQMKRKNYDVKWNMQLVYEGDFSEETFELIYDHAKKIYKNTKMVDLSEYKRLFTIGTLKPEVLIEDNKLTFSFYDQQMSYNRAYKIIDKEVGKLFEDLKSVVGGENAEYYIKIVFEDVNPFTGLFLQNVQNENIINYDVRLSFDNNKISINKNYIEFYSLTLSEINEQAKDYLSLSYNPIKNLKEQGSSNY